MKKRTIAILLIIVLCFVFAGCSLFNTKETNKNTTQNETVSNKDTTENQWEDIPQNTDSQSNASMLPEAVIIPEFQAICQYPELPTGCEMTSLTAVLNYHGLNADKCDISDNYLEKGAVGTVDFRKAFVGDPRDDKSYGCYAPVVTNTANSYLAANGSSLKASDVTGSELESLFVYINAQVPVIVWGTLDCQEGYYSVTWNVDGEELTWFTPEHCMVLVGYDQSSVWVADPIYGEVIAYDRELFKSRYDSLFKQAVVIQ